MLDPEDVGDREVAMVALELLREGRPADPAAAVDVRHLAQLVRLDRVPEGRRELGREEDEPADRSLFGGLEDQQGAHPVADRHGRRSEAVERGHDVVDVRLEGQLGRIGGPRPVVVLEVERVSLPAA